MTRTRCTSVAFVLVITAAASLHAQQTAVDARQKADVLERLATAQSKAPNGQAPSLVVDPAWPKRLPHNWIIGDAGGLFVDTQDHIWVYQLGADNDARAVASGGRAIGAGQHAWTGHGDHRRGSVRGKEAMAPDRSVAPHRAAGVVGEPSLLSPPLGSVDAA